MPVVWLTCLQSQYTQDVGIDTHHYSTGMQVAADYAL